MWEKHFDAVWFATGMLLITTGSAAAQCECPEPPASAWQTSFIPPDPVEATEVRQFAVYDGKLYAATGSWMDQGKPAGTAHVIRQDTATGPWVDEANFGDGTTGGIANLRFTQQKNGAAVNPPVNVLVASIWSGATVFNKNLVDGRWIRTNLTSPGQIRAFAVHTDTIANATFAFAAGKPGIFRGQLANSRPAGVSPIDWVTTEAKMELRTSNLNLPLCSGGGRVTGFAEARGALFASVCWRIYKRTDGVIGKCSPSQVEVNGACRARWVRFWDDPLAAQGESGLRGLTQVMHQQQQVLLVGSESANMHATRLDPVTAQATVEFNFTTYLRNLWAPARAGYGIIPYNSPAPLWYGPDGAGRRMFGFEVWLPGNPTPDMARKLVNASQVMNGEGFFFLRNSATNYQLFHIPAITPQPMTAVRDMIASPFKEDCNDKGQDCLVYSGVFDANKSTTQTPCTVAPCTIPPLTAVPTNRTGAIVKGRITLNATAISATAADEAEQEDEEEPIIPDRGASAEGNDAEEK